MFTQTQKEDNFGSENNKKIASYILGDNKELYLITI